VRIERGDLDDPRVVAILGTHLTRAWASHGSCHALDVDGLRIPEISFWTSWEGDGLAGMGALKRLGGGHGELKSMYVDDAFRGRGHARAMIEHLLGEARAAGLSRVSLETGAWDYFIPARALYAAAGFETCGPFEGYRTDPNSVFMTRAL
jgi:putative acetyltransferase